MIDCFCGAGGLSLGFKLAGFDPVLGLDLDQAAIATYNRNLGSHGMVADLRAIQANQVLSERGLSPEDIAVVCGGPPCQGFSVQRRGDDEDPRNALVREYIRFLLEISPRFFVMENVGGLLSSRGKPHLRHLASECDHAGYILHIAKLNALDFGVPQNRIRVFIVGERLDAPFARYSFPEPPELGNQATVRSAIFDLMERSAEDVPNHIADRLSPTNLERIRSIKAGQGREALPVHLQLPCHSKGDGHRHLDVYGRMSWDEPSPTITARFDSFSRGRFGHPELDRTITLREGARLQSFPDEFVFEGSKVQIAAQIGNAVPPLLAKAVGQSIMSCLEVSPSEQ